MIEEIEDRDADRLDHKLDVLSQQEHVRGHAFTVPPRAAVARKMKCEIYCSGNAIARAICVICGIGLCQHHTHTVNGKTYCKLHKVGFVYE